MTSPIPDAFALCAKLDHAMDLMRQSIEEIRSAASWIPRASVPPVPEGVESHEIGGRHE